MKRVASLSSLAKALDSKVLRTEACFICDCSENEDLVLFTSTSWNTLCTYSQKWAALIPHGVDLTPKCSNVITKIRQYSVADDVVGTLRYHRTCYQHITHKNHLQRAEKKCTPRTVDDDASTSSVTLPSLLTRSKESASDFKKCIICQRDKIDPNNRRKSQPLRRFEQDKPAETFKDAARIHKTTKNGQRIWSTLEVISFDVFAYEIVYHKNCLQYFERDSVLDKLQETNDDVGPNSHKEAFSKLCVELDEHLFVKNDVMKMSVVRSRYCELLKSYVDDIDISTIKSSRLKQKLQHWYGSQIGFWHPKHKSVSVSEIIYSTNVDTGEVIECGVLGQMADDPSLQLYECCKSVRENILKTESLNAWPPKADDICETNIKIPPLLYNMLAWIMSATTSKTVDTNGRVAVGKVLHRRILSLGQDIIFCASNGKIVTPKSLSLPWTVRQVTGSAEIVHLLNRFGHGVSNEVIREAETAIAEKASCAENLVPASLSPGVPLSIAFDNTDINEETLTGGGTFHGTSGCIIQQNNPSVPKTGELSMSRTKQRSFKSCQSEIPPYYAGKRISPTPVSDIATTSLLPGREFQHAQDKNFSFILQRSPSAIGISVASSDEPVASWTGFNHNSSDANCEKALVEQIPVTSRSPTEMPVIYSMLCRSDEIRKVLDLDFIMVVSDHAIYCKMVEVLSKEKELFSKVIVRMGGFHIIMNFASVIGTRFGLAGLRDLMIESGIVAAGSVDAVLNCKHYNRCMRSLKLIYEAMVRMKLCAFITWLEHQLSEDVTVTHTVINKEELQHLLNTIRTNPSHDSLQALLNSDSFTGVARLWRSFSAYNHGPMFNFWDSFCYMCDLLLNLIRSFREANWVLHLECIRRIIPFMFAYGHHNYARHLPYYWTQMSELPKSNLSAHEYLLNGGFTAQLSDSNKFGKVPLDYVVEKANRAMKVKGGIVKFSRNTGAVDRWILSQHVRGSIAMKCRELAGINIDESGSPHIDLSLSRMRQDKHDVDQIVQTCTDWGVNPFTPSSSISILSSGFEIDDTAAATLVRAEEIGEQAVTSFITKRIHSAEEDFYAPIKKTGIESLIKPRKGKLTVHNRDMIVKADRKLFVRMTIIGQKRKLDMKEVMKYPLSPVPPSLTTSDGFIFKTRKSVLAGVLEKYAKDPGTNIQNDCVIIDAMAILHSLTHIPDTWGELAAQIFQKCIVPHFRSKAKRVDFVADVYKPNSIKDTERIRRNSHDGMITIKISGRDQKTPSNQQNWKRFLAGGENKMSLVEFLAKEWSTTQYIDSLSGNQLYVTTHERCLKIDGNTKNAEICEDLLCFQEEADTRMVFHIQHASTHGHESIQVISPDTDVEILLIAFAKRFSASIYFKSGTVNRPRLIDINSIADALPPTVTKALLGFHALTGCDSVEAFVNKGKVRPFKLLVKNQQYADILGMLGNDLEPSNIKNLMKGCCKFVCDMYGQSQISDVAQLRYELLAKQQSASHLLPPTEDQLYHHLLRANYQTWIWIRSLETQQDIPSPQGNGWIVDNEGISVQWTTQEIAPKEILEMISCGCGKKTQCTSENCSCKQQGLFCTDACTCSACGNITMAATDYDSEIEYLSESDDEVYYSVENDD